MSENVKLAVNDTLPWRPWLVARLITLARVYGTGLLVWALLRFFFQDNMAWLFLINSLALYLFLPLLLLLLAAVLIRRRILWLVFGLALGLWLALYGSLFWPKRAASLPTETSKTLTVMTSNVLGFNGNAEAIVDAILASGADVVGLGELNPHIAAAVSRDLSDRYPYQVLEARPGVDGAGVISRYPLSPTGETLGSDYWIGTPQLLTLDLAGEPVNLVHFHAIPLGSTGGVNGLMFSVNKREEQARAIVDYVKLRRGPTIVFGDLNATDQHKAYSIVRSALQDSWREAGWGFGHTFPGASSEKSSRPIIFGIPAPMWMIRIDYVFHTEEWQATSARIGPWDGMSDHRPVVATLVLRDAER